MARALPEARRQRHPRQPLARAERTVELENDRAEPA